MSKKEKKIIRKCQVCHKDVIVDLFGNGICLNCGWEQSYDGLDFPNIVRYPNKVSYNKAKRLYADGKPFIPSIEDFVGMYEFYSEVEFQIYNRNFGLVNYDGKMELYEFNIDNYQIFLNRDDFINNAIIEGELLKNIWYKVKKANYMGCCDPKDLGNDYISKIGNIENFEILSEDEYKEEMKKMERKTEKRLNLTRNQYETVGKYGFPLIKKQFIDVDKIDLLCYTKTKINDKENSNKSVHFFTYDWFFDNVYDKPEKALEKLEQYYALLTPDFSCYFDMPRALQIYSIFKNRWCGAHWQDKGFKVIPTIEWGQENTFDFCFDGIEKGSVVAVSTYRREKYEKEYMKGYNKMMEIIQPSAIICYGQVFNEMTGNIKCIQPFNYQELIEKLGYDKFMEKYLNDELYPSK